jgi:hypothetical protein
MLPPIRLRIGAVHEASRSRHIRPIRSRALEFRSGCTREMMAKVTTWTGSASDLQRFGADHSPDGCSARSSGWPKSPRALAGRLRRVQTSLRALGIEIAFSREGRGGTRIIRITASHENLCENTVSTVSTSPIGSLPVQDTQPGRLGLVGRHPVMLRQYAFSSRLSRNTTT